MTNLPTPEIIPAIMPQSFADLEEKVARVVSHVKNVQLDIMDGDFVPEKTWPYLGDILDFQKLIKEDMGLPEWEKINYEIDLMVSVPDRDAFEWITAGASRIIIHLESHPDVAGIINRIRQEYGRPLESPTAPEIGVALNLDTPIEQIYEFIPLVDFVQLMGIAEIGYQSQPFDNRVLERIKILRKKYPELIMSVDGAVNAETAPLLIEAGVNRLVSGSYIFNSGDIKEAIENLKQM